MLLKLIFYLWNSICFYYFFKYFFSTSSCHGFTFLNFFGDTIFYVSFVKSKTYIPSLINKVTMKMCC